MPSLLPTPPNGQPAAGPDELGRLAALLAQHLDATSAMARPIPWDAFRAEFLALYEPPMRSTGTRRAMRQTLDILAGLGVATTADLTPELVARFIAARPPGESPNTTYGMVAKVRTLCNYAAARGYLFASPFALRKHWVRKARPAKKRHHTRKEIARVLALARRDVGRRHGWSQWRARRLYALAATVAYTGLRRNEALFLRVEDLDIGARTILVRPRRGNRLKTEAAAQTVPMPEALVPILVDWLPSLVPPETLKALPPHPWHPEANPDGTPDPGWLFPNSYRSGPWVGGSRGRKPNERMRMLGRRAGVEGFNFQSLRHSWATHAEFWGLSDAMIQRVLRHTSPDTQWNYRHADAENMRSKVAGIGFGDEAVAPADGTDPAPTPAPAQPPTSAPAGIDRGPRLSEEDAAEMRELRDRGWTYKALRERYRVSKSTVHYTIHGVIHRPADGEGYAP